MPPKINLIFIFISSYDGSGYGGLSDPPARGRSPSRISYNNTPEIGLHWRTASAGAADLKGASFIRNSCDSKMGDINLSRGHSPHFSPSRSNGKFY